MLRLSPRQYYSKEKEMTNLKNTWVHDFGKFKMVLDESDVDISKQVKEFGWYEDEKFECSVFEKYLKEGMTVLDLGANIGFYTMFARSRVGATGKVFAFEPFPNNANLIRASVKENSFTNVTIVEAAVSDRIGKTILHLSPDACSEHSLLDLNFQYGSDSSPSTIEVQVVTVDEYLKKNATNLKVDFIKMDIEGSESHAIKGMKNVLDENKHIVLITEFWPNGFIEDNKNPKDFLETLHQLNFKIYNINNLEQKIEPVTVNEMMKIVDFRSKNIPKENTVMQTWGWYTNLLCIR